MLRSKIRDIKIKSESILEELGVDGTSLTAEEIKTYASKVYAIADECLSAINSVEFYLLELLKKIKS